MFKKDQLENELSFVNSQISNLKGKLRELDAF